MNRINQLPFQLQFSSISSSYFSFTFSLTEADFPVISPFQFLLQLGLTELTLGQILHDELHWLDVPDQVFFKLAVTVHRCLNGRAPLYLSDYCVAAAGADTRRQLRSSNRQLLAVPRYRLNTYGCRVFSVAGPTIWHSLPDFFPGPDHQRRLFRTPA